MLHITPVKLDETVGEAIRKMEYNKYNVFYFVDDEMNIRAKAGGE